MFTPESITVEANQDLTNLLQNRTSPLVIKGLLSHWSACSIPQDESISYLKSIAANQLVYVNQSLENSPRFFYTADLKDKNFSQMAMPFNELLSTLEQAESQASFENTAKPGHADLTRSHSGRKKQAKQATFAYMASTSVAYCMPEWLTQNPLNLNVSNPLISAWLGTQSVAATHFDIPQNLACNVFGRRRFTLFPPEQIDNLYIGPIDFTPAGQPVSLVDVNKPDYERFPKYKTAQQHAYQVTLEPGDALFIPSMWWHNVEALTPVNLLINYWWQTTPAFVGQPMDAIKHALLSVKMQSVEQKRAWLKLLEYWLLNEDWDHLPEEVKTRVSELDEKTARQLRAELLKNLNR